MGNIVNASYWEMLTKQSKEKTDSKDNNDVKCLLCPNYCIIRENAAGKCGVRYNDCGILIASAYGILSSVALDPIEKKPLYEFQSGKMILSIGSYGCNFHCPFCQNYSISTDIDSLREPLGECFKFSENSQIINTTPDEIAQLAVKYIPHRNIGVAYTYNEPLINFEFVKDCCLEVKKQGLVNVLVTNGYINIEPLEELLPLIDAANIDIKGDNERTYNTVGGTLNNIQKVVELSCKHAHIEITTLVIPENDEGDIENIAKWLASIDKNIPYHLSRFFPRHKYSDRSPTPIEKMYRLRDVASKYLNKVYLGNI